MCPDIGKEHPKKERRAGFPGQCGASMKPEWVFDRKCCSVFRYSKPGGETLNSISPRRICDAHSSPLPMSHCASGEHDHTFTTLPSAAKRRHSIPTSTMTTVRFADWYNPVCKHWDGAQHVVCHDTNIAAFTKQYRKQQNTVKNSTWMVRGDKQTSICRNTAGSRMDICYIKSVIEKNPISTSCQSLLGRKSLIVSLSSV